MRKRSEKVRDSKKNVKAWVEEGERRGRMKESLRRRRMSEGK